MQRRVFLKALAGFGAAILPWTEWPYELAKLLAGDLGPSPARLTLPLQAASPQAAAVDSPQSVMKDIIALSSPEMQGRQAGTLGEGKAALYLTKQLSTLGLKPLGDGGAGFTQAFTIPPVHKAIVQGRLTFAAGDRDSLRTPCANLIGVLVGATDEVVLLSAHYDHLGVYEGQLYPGANDNASGVACVLAVLRRLRQEAPTLKRTVAAAFWSAEECGFFGSQALAAQPPFPLTKVKAVFNLDTIGNGMIGDFVLWADGENLAVKTIQEAAAAAKASASLAAHPGHNSDQVSFARAGIPAVSLVARDWLNKNHTPQDTVGMIKEEQVNLAADIIYRAVWKLAVE